jgi:hypothetical protein
MRPARLVALGLVFSMLPCVAQERALVRAKTDLAVFSLGDRITLTVEVEHGAGQTVNWPALSDTLGSFEVVGSSEGAPVVIEGRQTSTMRYALTTFELGELEIPAIEVAVVDSGNAESQLLGTEPIPVVVESVGIDEGGDIRTVKAPLEIPRNWLLLLPWVLLVGGLTGLGYWLYRRYRSRQRTSGDRPQYVVPARPAHEVAYEALNRLEEKRLLERGETKQYFIEVSEIIRIYLEGRYPIDALEMTSHEVLQELKRVGLEPEVFDLFPPFFSRADLVKFAKHRPRPEISKDMIPMARLLVDETRVPDVSQQVDSFADSRDGAVAEENVGVG